MRFRSTDLAEKSQLVHWSRPPIILNEFPSSGASICELVAGKLLLAGTSLV